MLLLSTGSMSGEALWSCGGLGGREGGRLGWALSLVLREVLKVWWGMGWVVVCVGLYQFTGSAELLTCC